MTIVEVKLGARDAPAMLSLRGAVRTRRIKSAAFRLAALGTVVLVLGFGVLGLAAPGREVALDRNADGIVVLTGGTSRVTDGLAVARFRPQAGVCSLPVSIPAPRQATLPARSSTMITSSPAASISTHAALRMRSAMPCRPGAGPSITASNRSLS